MEKNSGLFELLYQSNYYLLKDISNGKRILDAACDNGVGSYLLSSFGAENVVGMDIDVSKIQKAKKVYFEKNLEFVVGNVEQLQHHFGDSKFDIIVSNYTLEHVDNVDAFVLSLKSILSDNGILIISCPNDTGIYTPNFQDTKHKNIYSLQDFIGKLKQYLGPPSKILMSMPAYGIVNVEDTDHVRFSVENVVLQNTEKINNCLGYTAIYDFENQINQNGLFNLVDFSGWNKLISYDYVDYLKKERLIYEMQQRALVADALELELQLTNITKCNYDLLVHNFNALRVECDALRVECDALRVECDALRVERDNFNALQQSTRYMLKKSIKLLLKKILPQFIVKLLKR